jgi:DNA polymerase III gamma/tau subunit
VVTRLKEIAEAESKRGDKITITDEAAFLLARKSEGSMRDAVSALDQVLSTGVTRVDENAVNEVLGLVSREIFFDLGERFLSRDAEGTLAALHNAYREGVDPRDLAEGMLDHLRSLMVLRVNPNAGDLVVASDDERTRFEAQGREHDTADLLRLMRIVTEALGAMRDSAQPLTHLEVAVVEMASLEPGVHLAEIVDRLGGLKGGPTDAPAGGSAAGSAKTVTTPRKKTGARVRKSTDAPTASLEESSGSRVGGEAPLDPVASQARETVQPVASQARDTVQPVAVVDQPPTVAGRPGVMAEAEFAVAVAEEERGASESGPSAPPQSEPEQTENTEFDDASDPQWEQVLQEVKDKKVMVGVFLEESQRVGWDGAVLKIAADEVHRSILESPDNRDLLLKVLARVYEKKVMVRFQDLAPEDRKRRARSAAAASPPNRGAGAQPGKASQPDAQAETPSTVESNPAPGSSNEEPAETRISPEIEKAMVWFDGEIVQQSKPGGASK